MSGLIYEVKITLLEMPVTVWRQLRVDSDMKLSAFHRVIQTAMGWTNSHLHAFRAGEVVFSAAMPSDPSHLRELYAIDTKQVPLWALLKRAGSVLRYEYDFGDGWEHEIELLGIERPSVAAKLPLCVGGAGACPPEDVGGRMGYAQFVAALADASHPQHVSYREWYVLAGASNAC